MKTSNQRIAAGWRQLALLMLLALIVGACGRGQQAEEAAVPTTAPATAAPAETPAADAEESEATPAADAGQAESPLGQPESPISQPESPLTTATNKAPSTTEEALALAENTHAEAPGAGMGSIAGVVFSFGTVPGAIRGTQVYLEVADEVDGEFFPPAVSLGPSTAEGDVIVETNTLGQLFMEMPPGHYYAAVWTPYDWRLVVEEVGQEAPRLITIEEGDQVDLGVLYTYWP